MLNNMKHFINVDTLNVRMLYQAGKLENVIMETARSKINILSLSEVRWTGRNCIQTDKYKFIYYGGKRMIAELES